MKKKIRIGTRESELSLAQTMLAVEAMKLAYPDASFELVPKKTLGDKILEKPLLAFGGKGVFVSEFEEGLLQGEIDFAVHSAKDLPMELARGLEIAGVLPRGDERDVLIMPAISQGSIEKKESLSIGTSSLRRGIQIKELGKKLWPKCSVNCQSLRGNVLTRLSKLEQGQFDGIILAAAGLNRLEIPQKTRGRYQYRYFTPEEMVPAGGQGIIAIEGRKGDSLSVIPKSISHMPTMQQFKAERLVLKLLNAGCHEPVGVYCQKKEDGLSITGIYGTFQNQACVKESELSELQGISTTSSNQILELLARKLAQKLLEGLQSSGGFQA